MVARTVTIFPGTIHLFGPPEFHSRQQKLPGTFELVTDQASQPLIHLSASARNMIDCLLFKKR